MARLKKDPQLPLPELPPKGYTYAIDPRFPGRLVKALPPGLCNCRECLR